MNANRFELNISLLCLSSSELRWNGERQMKIIANSHEKLRIKLKEKINKIAKLWKIDWHRMHGSLDDFAKMIVCGSFTRRRTQSTQANESIRNFEMK